MSNYILRLPAVMARTGLARSTIYFRIKHNTFPKQIKLGVGARASGWLCSEIEDWLSVQIEQSRSHHGSNKIPKAC